MPTLGSAPTRSHARSGQRSLLVVLVAALALGALERFALALSLDPHGEDWEGLAQFVAIARSEVGKERVVLTSKLDLRDLDRADALLIVHPTRPLKAGDLAAFMHAGGRVLLLDDYGTGDGLLAHFAIRRIPLPQRPAEMLRGNPALAIAECDLTDGGHPAVRGVAHVVTNHATGLSHPALSPVLVVHGDGEPDVLLALAGSVGQGRFLAVGDASIPMNAMLRYPGNRALSLALIRYAVDDEGWNSRGGKLYVVANDFETIGGFETQGGIGGAAGETRRIVVEALDGLRRDGIPPFLTYLAALAVGLGVLFWASARAGRTHKPSVPRFVRVVPVASQGGVAGHAATVGAPGAARAAVMLELKSALEEQLATRLGLERTPSHDDLVVAVRAAGLLGEGDARALARLLATFARVETMVAARRSRARGMQRLRDKDVVIVAARMRGLLERIPR
jgi:hypothetical protein